MPNDKDETLIHVLEDLCYDVAQADLWREEVDLEDYIKRIVEAVKRERDEIGVST